MDGGQDLILNVRFFDPVFFICIFASQTKLYHVAICATPFQRSGISNIEIFYIFSVLQFRNLFVVVHVWRMFKKKPTKKKIAFLSLEIQIQLKKRERKTFISFYISLSYSDYHVIM